MGAAIAPQIITAASTLAGVGLTLLANEYRARKAQFQAERLAAAADLVAAAGRRRRLVRVLRSLARGKGYTSTDRLFTTDSSDPEVSSLLERYRNALEQQSDASARVALLFKEASVLASLESVDDLHSQLRSSPLEPAAFDAAYAAAESSVQKLTTDLRALL